MAFLDPQFTVQVPFERLVDEANGVWTPLTYQGLPGGAVQTATPSVVSLDKPTAQPGNGPRYVQGGTVFVPRGADRRHGDRFTYNGRRYRLIGAARGDQDHPITGDDFGWVAISFESSS